VTCYTCVCSVVLRNYVAQMAIDHAVRDDYSEVKRILSVLQKPFADWPTASPSDVAGCHVTPG